MGLKIEHRIGVQAPSDTIWDIIYDLPRWGEWNPIYPEAAGEVRIGNELTLTQALPGQPQQVIKPVVLDWVPREQLHWRTKALAGMVKTIRYIEIEELVPGSCILSNGEVFDGFLAKYVVSRHGRAMRRGFTAMGEALKAHAEAAWRAERRAPTSAA